MGNKITYLTIIILVIIITFWLVSDKGFKYFPTISLGTSPEEIADLPAFMEEQEIVEETIFADEDLIDFFPNLISITIGEVEVLASVADTAESRELGLSNTPNLPENLVKLFVFDSSERWGIWMKDMNYAIDILWLNTDREVIFIEKNISPDTYPQIFMPSQPARFVIETQAGFSDSYSVNLGTMVSW